MMKNNISDFFKPIFQNGEEITPQKWINSFLFLVSIQFLWLVIDVFISLNLKDTFELIVAILILSYIAIMCTLIFRKQKWGWILLFTEKLLTGFASLIYLVIIVSSEYFSQEEIGEMFWGIIISSIFISYLLKQDVYSHFKISKETKDIYIKRISILVVMICTIGLILVFTNNNYL